MDNKKLQSFFHDVVRQSFWQLGINDSTITGYVADVLTDFARMAGLELALIDRNVTFESFERELRWSQAYHFLQLSP